MPAVYPLNHLYYLVMEGRKRAVLFHMKILYKKIIIPGVGVNSIMILAVSLSPCWSMIHIVFKRLHQKA